MASDEYEFDRGEFLTSLIGSVVPAAGVLSWYYIEILPMFRSIPMEISVEQAAQFTAINTLIIFTAVIFFMASKLMNVGSAVGRWIHWRFFQGGDEENE